MCGSLAPHRFARRPCHGLPRGANSSRPVLRRSSERMSRLDIRPDASSRTARGRNGRRSRPRSRVRRRQRETSISSPRSLLAGAPRPAYSTDEHSSTDEPCPFLCDRGGPDDTGRHPRLGRGRITKNDNASSGPMMACRQTSGPSHRHDADVDQVLFQGAFDHSNPQDIRGPA